MHSLCANIRTLAAALSCYYASFGQIAIGATTPHPNASPIDALTLTCLTAAQHLSVYPNPVGPGIMLHAQLSSHTDKGKAKLQIYDGGGNRVYDKIVIVNKGVNTYAIPMAGLAQGIYMIVVTGESWRSNVVKFSRVGH